jgi:hypothetical protein
MRKYQNNATPGVKYVYMSGIYKNGVWVLIEEVIGINSVIILEIMRIDSVRVVEMRRIDFGPITFVWCH